MKLAQPWRSRKYQAFAAAVAAVLTGVGLIGGYFESHGMAYGAMASKLDLWFLLPGYFICILLGFLGVLQGGAHSSVDIFWLAAPISFITYDLLCSLIYICVRSMQHRDMSNEVGRVKRASN